MANRQLKIWRDDLKRYYDKTSLLMRVVIGGLLSFIFAYYIINKVVKPQNAQNKKLKEKLETMEVIEDVESRVTDLKNDTRKANMRLEGIEKVNQEITVTCGTLTRGEIGRSILELRSLIDRNDLRITREEKKILKKISYRRGRQKIVDTHVKINFPGTMAYDTQVFEVLGSFANLRHFLLAVHSSPNLIFLDNIKINQSKELLTDRELNQYRALRCEFEVHVPYLKSEPAVAKGGAMK